MGETLLLPSEMTSDDESDEFMSVPMNPRLLRRSIALALIRFRSRAGLTQTDAAKLVGCVQSRISNLESRRNLPKPADLRLLLPAYGVDERTIAEFEALLPLARRRNWWDSLPDDALPQWFGDFLAFEEGATAIQVFESMVVPGLLQTEDYARSLIHDAEPDLGIEEVERRVQVRMTRQDHVLGAENPPRLWFVITEAALRSAVGGPKVHRDQLDRLAGIAVRPRVDLQVLPAAVGAHPAMHGSFIVLQLPIEDDPGLVYLEDRLRGRYYEDVEAIAEYTHVLNRLRVQALDQEHSIAMISTIAEEIR